MTNTTDQRTEEARYWNEEGGQRWVENIDRLERMLIPFSTHLVERVDARPGEHIVDIGCGGGPTSARYAEQVGADGYVVGLDISDVILDVARQRFGAAANLQFITADAATYAFETARFDVITSRYGVMFFPHPAAAFRNIFSSAKAGGRLCMLCWRSLEENPWMALPARAAFEFIPPPEKGPPGAPGPFSLAQPTRTSLLLHEAGFVDIAMQKIDEVINLGSVDTALDWLTRMGPAARPLAIAEAGPAAAAVDAMRAVLAQHNAGDSVTMAAAAWLISAKIA